MSSHHRRNIYTITNKNIHTLPEEVKRKKFLKDKCQNMTSTIHDFYFKEDAWGLLCAVVQQEKTWKWGGGGARGGHRLRCYGNFEAIYKLPAKYSQFISKKQNWSIQMFADHIDPKFKCRPRQVILGYYRGKVDYTHSRIT